MNQEANFPVIVGVAQVVEHWPGDDINTAPHPVEIVKKAIDLALKDTGVTTLAEQIDCAAFIRTFPDSLPMPFTPFGEIKNFPSAVIARSEINPKTVIYSSAGGEQPQVLTAQLSEKLHAGEIDIAVIAGGEVTGALKAAMKKGLKLDWTQSADGEIHDEGPKTDFISGYEVRNGLGMPPQTYAGMEQALRARLDMSKAEYSEYIGDMFSLFSKVAEANPYAQFPTFRTSDFLAAPSKENYPTFEPYLKWHMAQDAVNQSAALILTTAGKARALGIAEEKWVYLHGHANVDDALVSKRPDLSRSQAMEFVLEKSLSTSGISSENIKYRDIYSCFPIVVHLAAEYLGLDPKKDQLTLTGGLPFFGGAGNNYSTHGIACMVEALRLDKDAYGLVLANGGFMSKEAAGVYSSIVPKNWTPISSDDLKAKINAIPDIALLNEGCEAVIEGYCIKHGRAGPDGGYVIAKNSEGRIIAKINPEDTATLNSLLAQDNVVGERIPITHRNGQNFFETPLK